MYCVFCLVFIQPICLPITQTMKNVDMSRSLPFIAGWGTTQPNPSIPPSKYKLVRIPTIYINQERNSSNEVKATYNIFIPYFVQHFFCTSCLLIHF